MCIFMLFGAYSCTKSINCHCAVRSWRWIRKTKGCFLSPSATCPPELSVPKGLTVSHNACKKHIKRKTHFRLDFYIQSFVCSYWLLVSILFSDIKSISLCRICYSTSLAFFSLFISSFSLSIIPRDSTDVHRDVHILQKVFVVCFFPIISTLSFQTYNGQRRPVFVVGRLHSPVVLLNSRKTFSPNSHVNLYVKDQNRTTLLIKKKKECEM